MNRGGKGWRLALRLAAAAAVTLVFVFPIYWLAAISIKTPKEIFAYPPVWIPAGIELSGYATLFRDGDAWAVWNASSPPVPAPCSP